MLTFEDETFDLVDKTFTLPFCCLEKPQGDATSFKKVKTCYLGYGSDYRRIA